MEKERLYYIDWLRALVVLSLIPFHSALTYTGSGDTYIYAVVNSVSVLPLKLFVSVLGSFFMPLLFFVSGIASYHSIQRRGEKGFVGERFRKLLVPFILGTLLLCPVQAYFKGLHDGFSGNLLQS
jgi:fucose 4-O-acetylase-like acetyltransferase